VSQVSQVSQEGDSVGARRRSRAASLRTRHLAGALVAALLLAACGSAPDPVVDTPDEGSAAADGAPTDAAGTDAGGSLGDTVDDFAGTWVVAPGTGSEDPLAGEGSFVGYRIDEELSNLGAITAVGRTAAVTGGFVIAGGTLTEAEFVVERLATLASDRSSRDGRVASLFGERGARLTLAAPVVLEAAPTGSDPVRITVPATLTVGDVTREVDADLVITVEGTTLVVRGQVATALSDLGLEAPRAPIVLSVSDMFVIEVQLLLVRG